MRVLWSACGAVVRGALRRTRGHWFDLALMAHQAIHPSGVNECIPGLTMTHGVLPLHRFSAASPLGQVWDQLDTRFTDLVGRDGLGMWKIRMHFDEICVNEDYFEISFPLLRTWIKVNVAGRILDLCATHNFVAVVTNEEIFIAHKDKLQEPLGCVYRKGATLNLEFEPSSWKSIVEVPFTQRTLCNDWCKEKKPPSDVILTATASTIYLISNIKDSSMLVRLFNEATYLSSDVIRPSVVQMPEELVIVMVASGYDHSIFLTDKGAVYALGTGSRGELGIGLVPRVNELTWLEALEGLNTVAIAAAGWHSAALTDDGDVYLWGWNHRGQLGDQKEKVEFYPSPLDIQLRIVRVALGEHFTSLWVAEDEEEPSITMGSKKIGMPALHLSYCTESPVKEPGEISSPSNDDRTELEILGEYEE
ncbi:hypothetical protein KIN20_026093 [Parelaphostrongylus tenuis]|uniref:Uncharacterized protein n=1 Tax=Parelaphostrongylus tenuis TaxID=148309 RepID=A0AAD5QUV2_PARTN|nr:hypothetical protein KIN20_026093 [Parelaphostrongylus tenuis]